MMKIHEEEDDEEETQIAPCDFEQFLKARLPLTAAQVFHLTSPERLAIGSGPLPSVAKKRPRQQLPTQLGDLVACLRRI